MYCFCLSPTLVVVVVLLLLLLLLLRYQLVFWRFPENFSLFLSFITQFKSQVNWRFILQNTGQIIRHWFVSNILLIFRRYECSSPIFESFLVLFFSACLIETASSQSWTSTLRCDLHYLYPSQMNGLRNRNPQIPSKFAKRAANDILFGCKWICQRGMCLITAS